MQQPRINSGLNPGHGMESAHEIRECFLRVPRFSLRHMFATYIKAVNRGKAEIFAAISHCRYGITSSTMDAENARYVYLGTACRIFFSHM